MTAPLDKPVTCPTLIGRTPERAALLSLIHMSGSVREHAALVSGEAGIGKSRLVAEAKSAALTHGFLLLQGDCFQADTSYPYAPLLDLLRSFFSHHLPASLVNDQEPLVRELVQLLPDLALFFPQYVPVSSPPVFDPEQQKRRLFTVLTHFFTRQTIQQPVLLLVEDIHWCDENSLEFLLHLARRCLHQPLFFLFTYRSEEMSPVLNHWLVQLGREHLALELALIPLSYAEVEAMLQAIFATSHPVPSELLAAIYTLTEGNPLFVEEMLKLLTATGDLQYADGIWEYRSEKSDPGSRAFIPRSVQDVVQQRTNQLSAEARQALTLAAIAGRRFDFTLLQQVLHCDEHHLLSLMKELIAAQLVIEASADQFVFRHALIRQAIYSELLTRERRLLHRAIAEALEVLSATLIQPDMRLSDLAYHFYAAGVWAKALEYEQRAGESALELYAPRAALEHVTHALEAADHLHLTPPGKVYYARGQAYETLSEFDHAHSDYEQALKIAHAESDGPMEWQCMMALGFLWTERNYAQAGTWFHRANDLAERLTDPTLQARSLNRLGNWLSNTGRVEEGLQAHQEALQIFEGQQNAQGMAETFDLLGTAYGMSGNRIKATEQLGRAIVLFRELGDNQNLISSLAMRAVQSMPGSSETTFCPLRTRDECVEDALESLHLAHQVESLAKQAFAENVLAHTLLAFGEFDPALFHAQEARRIATEIKHQQWMVSTSYALGHIYLRLLAPALAITSLEAGLLLARELGSTFWIAILGAYQSLAYILNNDLLAARSILQAIMPLEQHPRNMAERDVALAWGELALAQEKPELALQIANHLLASAPEIAPDQPAQLIPHPLKLKGEALMALARLDEAVEVLEDARRGAQERNARPILWMIHRALGRAYQLLQRADRARQERAIARQLIEEIATTISDAFLHDQFLQAALNSFPQEKPLHQREAVRQAFGGLTAREHEIAVLIAQGKTSREIAELLVISERTAEGHVSNILGKLDFTSRAQIAVWVVEKGLSQR